jgi:mannose-1-phosphate guanylyltransferase
MAKDTAPCASYASLYISKIHPNPNIIIFPSDHYIKNEKEFIKCIKIAFSIIKNEKAIITFGIKPSRPDINYGYIEIGEKITKNNYQYFQVIKFKEKPSLEIAKEYLAYGNHFWNSGIFVWSFDTLINSLNIHAPKIAFVLDQINKNWNQKNFKRYLKKIYNEFPSISIDYAIMEKTKPIYMIPATFDWDDIGTWASLERILNADENNNIIFGTPYLFDTENSIIYPEKSNVIALGLKNIIFIKHKNNILIADKKYASELKNHIKKRFNKNN